MINNNINIKSQNMPKFIIKGQKTLSGEIEVKGSKNCALKILPASLLCGNEISINKIPKIEDIKVNGRDQTSGIDFIIT